MKKNALAALALIFATAIANGQEPLEFKGVPLGTSVAEFKEKNPLYYCLGESSCSLNGFNSYQQCTLLERYDRSSTYISRSPALECLKDVGRAATYGGVPASLTFRFRERVFVSASASVKTADVAKIVDAMSERHGKPASVTNETLQNRMGAKFENVTYTWKIGADQIIASKYSSDVTRGSIILLSASEIQRLAEEQEKKRKAAPSDL